MKKFRKIKITINHIEQSDGKVFTEMNMKGVSNFTLQEIDSLINQSKRDYFKTVMDDFKNDPSILKDKPKSKLNNTNLN